MSRFFKAEEFLCKCGRAECDAPKAPSDTLLALLDVFRERLGRPVAVTSGMRCAFWNKHEGGKPESGHLTADEVDVACVSSRDRWDMLRAIYQTGAPLFPRLGIGKNFLHLGTSDRLDRQVVWTYYN